MTKFEQRLDTIIKMLISSYITISPSGFTKIKESLLTAAKEELWHDAQGNNLPEIDREVVVIDIRGKISYGHRPDPKGFHCKNIDTGEIEHLEPMTYGKGGWNFPDVRWWLDLDLPNVEE